MAALQEDSRRAPEMPPVEALLDAATQNFSEGARKLMLEAAPKVEATLGGLPQRGISQVIGLSYLVDNSYSMEEDEIISEQDRMEGRPVKKLFERAVEGLNGAAEALQSSSVAARIETYVDLLNRNPSYVSKVTGGKESFEWSPVLQGTPHLSPRYFCTDGGTPLRRRTVETIASGLARSQWLQQPPFNLQTVFKYLIITDANSTEGSSYPKESDVADLIRSLPENHQVFLLGLESDDVDFVDVGARLGIGKSRVKTLPRDGRELRHFLQLWSQSSAEGSAVQEKEELEGLLMQRPESFDNDEEVDALFTEEEDWDPDLNLNFDIKHKDTVTTPSNEDGKVSNVLEPGQDEFDSLFDDVTFQEKDEPKK